MIDCDGEPFFTLICLAESVYYFGTVSAIKAIKVAIEF